MSLADPSLDEAFSPVAAPDERPPSGKLEDTIGLCLSGGGYRAMLFHLGALWRFNECGYFPRLARLSSVSGGSITLAVLGYSWSRLAFDSNGVAQAFAGEVVAPIRRLARHTIDIGAVIRGALLRGSISDRVAGAYDRQLFHGATLQDLPDPPRFIINATNVQSGALWRFMKPYMRDYKVCEVKSPRVRLASAVAASSAFPPFLSPLRLKIDNPTPGPEPLNRPPYNSRAVLTDGGVYDNMGLETVWKRCKTVFVSDGGGRMAAEPKPNGDWARHALRANTIIDNQVRALRKRNLIESYERGLRRGAYWGMHTNVADYGSAVRLDCPLEVTRKLAGVATRLAGLDDRTQEQLINFGYAICDAGVRRWYNPNLQDPAGFPYKGGLG